MIKSQLKFSEVVGESHTTVRNRHGRGDQPRDVGPLGIADGGRIDGKSGSRFVVADAVAWFMCKDLTELGLSWSDAAKILRKHIPADLSLRDGINPSTFFAIWEFSDHGEGQFEAWRGTPAEIAEALAYDANKYGVVNVRMVSIWTAFETARMKAAQAGYAFEKGEIVATAQPTFPTKLVYRDQPEGDA